MFGNQDTRTWVDNAREFGALSKQGVDVRLAVLVACSVHKGTGGPRTVPNGTVKVSAREFAEAAGTGPARVMRHLDAWNRASDLNYCPSADELSPEDALDPELVVPTEEQFRLCYVVPDNAGGRTMGNIKTAVTTIEKRGAAAVIEALTPEQKTEVAREVIRQADPVTMDTIKSVVRNTERVETVTDLSAKRREAEQRLEAKNKARHSERYLSIDVTLTKVRKLIADARTEAQGVEFSDWERADLEETVTRLSGDMGLLRLVIVGESGADWDAGLAALNAGGN